MERKSAAAPSVQKEWLYLQVPIK